MGENLIVMDSIEAPEALPQKERVYWASVYVGEIARGRTKAMAQRLADQSLGLRRGLIHYEQTHPLE